MANSNNKTIIFLNVALVLLVLVLITVAESKSVLPLDMFDKSTPALRCLSVVGVKSGDTCIGIAKANHVDPTDFALGNPNLNCTALFIGQWICVAAP